MLDILVKVVIAAGVYLLADTATEKITGKHIHTHVFDWWSLFRDKITQYIHTHDMGGKDVILRVVDAVDNKAVQLNKALNRMVKLKAIVRNKTSRTGDITITEENLPEEEILKQFPAFAERKAEILYC